MKQKIQRIVRLVEDQEQIKGKGYFRDEADNINGLVDSLRHLSEPECSALAEIKSNEKYRSKILGVVINDRGISPHVRARIIEVLG